MAERYTDPQDILRNARDKLYNNEDVPVSTSDESDNPVDKNAIAFKCFLGNKWHKLGYATTEVLDELHHAIQSKSICNVTFKDIRFVCIWSRSAPGFYAAVNITKIGLWSNVVRRHASTF